MSGGHAAIIGGADTMAHWPFALTSWKSPSVE
jgi:hypothetical protein